jgi:hypothetical protein
MPQERKDQRSRTLKTGKILLEGGGVIDCVIRDLSESGARIRIATPTPLPQRFQLQTGAGGMIVSAELRWQRGVDAGLRFPTRPKSPSV